MAIEKKNSLKETPIANKQEAISNIVYVYTNLCNGQRFKIKDKDIEIKGYTVDRLRLPNGAFIPGGQYEVTLVNKSDWDEVMRIYGKMEIFQSGLVFSAPSREIGDAMAKEREALRHGKEPLDPSKHLLTQEAA